MNFLHLCLAEGVSHWGLDTETQQVRPPQSRMEESSYTHRRGADGEREGIQSCRVCQCCTCMTSPYRPKSIHTKQAWFRLAYSTFQKWEMYWTHKRSPFTTKRKHKERWFSSTLRWSEVDLYWETHFGTQEGMIFIFCWNRRMSSDSYFTKRRERERLGK